MDNLTLNKKVGRRIARFRKLSGLTQNQLSEKSQCSSEFLSRLERGVCAGSLKRIDMIAKALGVPLKALFDFGEERENRAPIEGLIVLKRDENGELVEEQYAVYQPPSVK